MCPEFVTDYSSPTRIDGKIEGNKHTNSEKSPTVGVAIGVSVGFLFLVGGAVGMVLLKRRGMLPCNRKTGNNTSSTEETSFRENMTYNKSIENKVANHTYFILEKCEQAISNNAEHCNESNEANMEDDYTTIHETEEPYEHVKDESSYYDHTTNALPSESDARKPDNVYNKHKIDRLGDNVHGQRHGQSVFLSSEDDCDTTAAVVTHGMDDDSGYNHIPRTAYKAYATDDNIKGDEGGNYDAINNVKFKVSRSDRSDHAHVNTDRIK
ncbi:hypothetical protein DPMN_128250 [Dreissena polymorpha]|uniref:Uncharacterized protein n=1 Tax=Dreissena polymorpha TaxID=45954 RepID=A0A9D4H3I9_DREPO|nr:hypothetical protein DPMN_128250 [Dreissena polymorpha]